MTACCTAALLRTSVGIEDLPCNEAGACCCVQGGYQPTAYANLAGAATGAGAQFANLQGLAGAQNASQNLLQQVYDPMALNDISKLNQTFMKRQQPMLIGSLLHGS